MLLTSLIQAMSFITVMGKHPIHSTLLIFLKFCYPKQSVSRYSLLCIHNIHSAHQYNRSPPLLLLAPVIPPSPTATALSTSELLLTTLTQAVSFITVMGKHPIHSTLVIFLKFRYPKQPVSCYSLLCIHNIHSAHQYNRSPSITSPNSCHLTITSSQHPFQQVSCY
ncbi:hypothetical protein [Providencia rettgeri]|uniref:hypothetical protein n=1 Tax=Providencia rettgeri TaxID=587 RepID=UPI0018C66985|nr:hypothetical protein [Providencia rettgeri]MBG5926494.1 hypothetical protein [Providencia rettgeri]